MKKILAFTLAAAFTTSAFAASETYIIEGTHTLPRFEYSHLGYSVQLSRFDKTTGTIVLDRAAKTGSVEVTIDATSINTGVESFNKHLQAPDFFDTEVHPVITFKSSQLNFDKDVLIAVHGDLTIKGVTKPITLNVLSFKCMPHPMRQKDACGATATVKIKRSDFNMGKYAPHVGDEVTLTLPVEAVKE